MRNNSVLAEGLLDLEGRIYELFNMSSIAVDIAETALRGQGDGDGDNTILTIALTRRELNRVMFAIHLTDRMAAEMLDDWREKLRAGGLGGGAQQ